MTIARSRCGTIPISDSLRSKSIRFWPLLVGCLAACLPELALGQGRAKVSPEVEQCLAWLPANTETVLYGKSSTLPKQTEDAASRGAFSSMALGIACEKKPDWWGELAGAKVEWALLGGRNYDWVTTTLPTYRCEECAIIRFEQESPQARQEWEERRAKDVAEVRTLAGRKVYVYPSELHMKPRFSRKPWQHDSFVWLDGVTLLAATSDDYLAEVLERTANKPAALALPAELPEWKYLDPTSTVWLLRRVPRPETPLLGLTWQSTGRNVAIAYVFEKGQAERMRPMIRKHFDDPAYGVSPKLDAPNDETVVVRGECPTLPASGLPDLGWSPFFFSLYYAQADDSSPGYSPEALNR